MKKKLSFKLVALAVAAMLLFSPLKAQACEFTAKAKKVIYIAALIISVAVTTGLLIFLRQHHAKRKIPTPTFEQLYQLNQLNHAYIPPIHIVQH